MKGIILIITLFFVLNCVQVKKPLPKKIVKIKDSIVNVELAQTPSQRETGLMFRTNMLTNQGMLFIFDKPEVPSFYMKDTLIPLDILFINSKGKVVSIQSMAPLNETNLFSPKEPIIWALEVNLGWAKKHKIQIGNKVYLRSKK